MDNNHLNLSELWHGQNAEQIPVKELLDKIKSYKKSAYKSTVLTTLLLSATSLFIVLIWINYQPAMFTTKMGIALILLAMAIYGLIMNQQYPLLKKLDNSISNHDYLNNLASLRKKQHFLQTSMLNFYFLLILTGVLLYMVEPVNKMTLFWAVGVYCLTVGWIAFVWFYLRRKKIKKQQARLIDIIGKVENLNKQLNE